MSTVQLREASSGPFVTITVPDGETVLPVPVPGVEHVFGLSDLGKVVRSESADPTSFTVPSDSAVEWPEGAIFYVSQGAAGAVTIAGADGVTVRTTATKTRVLDGLESFAMLWRTGANAWTLTGELVLA